jgi:hypothetical protein
MGDLIAVLRRVKEDAGDSDAAGIEVAILAEELGEAADEQAGDDEEGDGAGYFGGDEEMTGALAFSPAGNTGGAGLEGGLRIDAHRAERGQQAEEEGGKDGERGGSKEHGP